MNCLTISHQKKEWREYWSRSFFRNGDCRDLSYFDCTRTTVRPPVEYHLKAQERALMSLRYKISPELNMILYVGQGSSTPSDFFGLEKAAFLNHPRLPGMITLVDALELSTSFDLNDIHRFIDNIDRMTKSGMEPGPYIMLTRDWGLHLLADAAKLIAGKLDLKARMYHTIEEAILALGLSDQKNKVIQLWNECKLESQTAPEQPL